MQTLRHQNGHVNPRHPLGSPLTVHEVVLTGLTATIEIPMRWAPTPEEIAPAERQRTHHGLP